MLKDIIAVQPLTGYQLYLTFEDDRSGIVDLTEMIEFTGIFEPLKDSEYFASVRVDPDLGTICWDNGADLDPVVLYAKVSHPNHTFADIRDRILPERLSGKILAQET